MKKFSLIPTIAAGVIAAVSSVSSYAVTSTAQLSGVDVAYMTSTSMSFSNNTTCDLYCAPEDVDVSLSGQTGIFFGQSVAKMNDILAFDPNFSIVNPFLDFGSAATGLAGLTDGVDVFQASSASYTVANANFGSTITVVLDGTFEWTTGFTSLTSIGGDVTMTLQSELSKAGFESAIANGTVGPLALSAVTMTTAVPEPSAAALLGLGLAGLVLGRRRAARK
jgi:hypothetical protein